MLMEIQFQLGIMEKSFERLDHDIGLRRQIADRTSAIIHEGGPPPLEAEQREFRSLFVDQIAATGHILGDIQNVIAAAGIVASILWPDRPHRKLTEEQSREREARGTNLRTKLGVDGDSLLNYKLAREKDVRGGLLHVDEMIEEISWEQGGDSLLTFVSGPISTIPKEVLDSTVRWFDEENYVLHVKDRELPLRVLLGEVRQIGRHLRLQAKVRLQLTKPGAPPPVPFIGLISDLKVQDERRE
jgi:hypothetical protein